jgi:uncharacterized RDD family membrane protein YckC
MVNMMGGDGDAVFRVDLDAPSPRPNRAGIGVISADGLGRISLLRSVARWFTVNAFNLAAILIGYALPSLGLRAAFGFAQVFLLGWVCVYTPVYFRRDGRGLHDTAARTIVLKRRF